MHAINKTSLGFQSNGERVEIKQAHNSSILRKDTKKEISKIE